MSVVTTESPPAAVPPSPPKPPSPRPVVRPKTGRFQLLRDVLDHGGPGYLQFAITNICNADCGFCGFARSKFDPKARRSVTLAEARDVIDICVKNHIGYLLFVGGEPMVHRDLRAMTRYAAERGVHPMVCTNGGLWTEDNMRGLVDNGLTSVIMSIDAHDIAKARAKPWVARGLPQDPTPTILPAAGRPDHGERHGQPAHPGPRPAAGVRFELLGFRSCTFSYPLTASGQQLSSFSDSGLVSYTKDELIECVRENQADEAGAAPSRWSIPRESLDEMQRHLRGEREHFGCLAGHKYFYLDWKLDLYRCHFWETPMCNICDFDASKLIRDGCTRCMIDCYRDPSVLQFIAVNASDAWHNAKRGKLIAAAKNVLDRRNLTSLRAVWEERKWIGGV